MLVPDRQVNEIDLYVSPYVPLSQEVQVRIHKGTSRVTIVVGCPEHKPDFSLETKTYGNFPSNISCIGGILYKSHKLIVPTTM